ncbi:helix-turn-helix domain-containing protein [Evtepia sp.]|uniref:helix-turn-helix domain-containing protein n=1 Tax=Evtepia sp. TaxID=2773933 RepID=UPI003990C4D6
MKEVAAYLKTSRQQVRKMIQSGTLYAVQVGREYRIPEEALAAWLSHKDGQGQ